MRRTHIVRMTPALLVAIGGTLARAQECYLTPVPAVPPVPELSTPFLKAYDTARSRILAAQWTSLGPMKLYAWSGSTWTLLSANGPSQRSHPAMAYDIARDRLVLFGGGNAPGPVPFPTDTWEWDGNSWVVATVFQQPTGRWQHDMCYDAARQRVVMFGGDPFTPDTSGVWEYDGVVWQVSRPTISPQHRSQPHLTFDSARSRVQLHGGSSTGELTDFWEWDGSAWAQLPSAPGRAWALTYDPSRARTFYMKGQQVWEFDATSQAWSHVVNLLPTTYNGLSRTVFDSGMGRIVFPTTQGLNIWNAAGSEEPISILTQPGGGTFHVGTNATLSITAAGTGNITYQWFKSGQALINGGHISGAQTTQLRLTPVSSVSDAGTYHAEASNSCGTVSSPGGLVSVIDPCGTACYANCDQSTACPTLTANDFLCYLAAYNNNGSYADCDGVGGLTSGDFICFLTAYNNGCS
jgi:hypothetical protein